MNGFHTMKYHIFIMFILIFVNHSFTEAFTNGKDWGYGVHDFMGQHTNQFLPGFHFILFQNGTYVL